MSRRIKYGVLFEDASELDIEFYMYREQSKAVPDFGGEQHGQAFHMINGLKILYTEEQLTWSDWLVEQVHAFCNNDFFTVFGAASCGKSNNFGAILMFDWWSDPQKTLTYVCSTTKGELEKRIWEAVLRYWHPHKNTLGGKLSKQRMAILPLSEKDDGKAKAGIHGVAVRQGTEQDTASALSGVHLPHIRLVIDEMHVTRRGAVEARHNLSKGTQDFKFVGIGNPRSWSDPLGEMSMPVDDHGRPIPKSVNMETHIWKTKLGKCFHYNGYDSPACQDPEKYFFLINQKQIDNDRKEYTDASPYFYQYVYGFVAPEGVIQTVFSGANIVQFGVMEEVRWRDKFTMVAGLDPAFSWGGDKCIFYPAMVGYTIEGILAIQFLPPETIPITLKEETGVAYVISRDAIARCKKYGILKTNFGIDDTGPQSIADIVNEEWDEKGSVHRVLFNSAPTDLPISVHNPKPAKNYYANRVTELWYNMYEFARYDQLKGLVSVTCDQLTSRELKSQSPKRLIPKSLCKLELSGSPDEADAAACALAVVREVMGIHPGATIAKPRGGRRRKVDFSKYKDFNKSTYTQTPIFERTAV